MFIIIYMNEGSVELKINSLRFKYHRNFNYITMYIER